MLLRAGAVSRSTGLDRADKSVPAEVMCVDLRGRAWRSVCFVFVDVLGSSLFLVASCMFVCFVARRCSCCSWFLYC